MWGLVGCSFVGWLLLSALLGEAYLGAVTGHGGVEDRQLPRRLGRGLRRLWRFRPGAARGWSATPPPGRSGVVAALGKPSYTGARRRRADSEDGEGRQLQPPGETAANSLGRASSEMFQAGWYAEADVGS